MTVAFVTGAKGFIGCHLSLRLANQGTVVGGVGHGLWDVKDAAVWGVSQWINGAVELSNLDLLASYIGTPDVIYHLAGGSSVGPSIAAPKEDFSRTVNSTMEVLEWMRRKAPQASLLLSSSAAVYGAGHTQAISESSPVSPYSPYGYHKYLAEQLLESYAKSYGLRTSIVRLFSVYGTRLRKQLLWDLCQRFKECPTKISLGGFGSELRDWLHVTDAVNHMVFLGQAANEDCLVVNAGTGYGVTVKEVATIVRDCWELDTKIEFSGQSRAGDPQYLVADTQYSNSLGLNTEVQLADGIREYVEWFKRL